MAAFVPPMLTREQAVEIRVLARRGMGLREIARQMGMSRNTVRRYLRQPWLDRYGPRAPAADEAGCVQGLPRWTHRGRAPALDSSDSAAAGAARARLRGRHQPTQGV